MSLERRAARRIPQKTSGPRNPRKYTRASEQQIFSHKKHASWLKFFKDIIPPPIIFEFVRLNTTGYLRDSGGGRPI